MTSTPAAPVKGKDPKPLKDQINERFVRNPKTGVGVGDHIMTRIAEVKASTSVVQASRNLDVLEAELMKCHWYDDGTFVCH